MSFKTSARYAMKKTNTCICCGKVLNSDYELIRHKDKEHHKELMESMGITHKKA